MVNARCGSVRCQVFECGMSEVGGGEGSSRSSEKRTGSKFLRKKTLITYCVLHYVSIGIFVKTRCIINAKGNHKQ